MISIFEVVISCVFTLEHVLFCVPKWWRMTSQKKGGFGRISCSSFLWCTYSSSQGTNSSSLTTKHLISLSLIFRWMRSLISSDLRSPVICRFAIFDLFKLFVISDFRSPPISDLRSLRRIFDLDESPVLLKSDLDLLQIFRSWSSTSEKSSIFYVLKRSLDLQFWSFRSKI